MKKSEILRVTQLCQATSCLGMTEGDDIHDESDLNITTVCSLWGGMGHLYRVQLPSGRTLVIKHVSAAASQNKKKPSLGDARKATSYQIEANFYERLAPQLIEEHGIRLPTPLHVDRHCGKAKNEIVIAMSDIRDNGNGIDDEILHTKHVLAWLAAFHAIHWGSTAATQAVTTIGLQPVGGYWHLDTRPDEHAAMPSRGWQGRLKRAARAIDNRLKRDPLQCIVHGDAKDANVLVAAAATCGCAEEDTDDSPHFVYLCDFQYCGKAPPTVDLAYFLCTSATVESEAAVLEFYLDELKKRLPTTVSPPTMQQLVESLDIAYCDYYRFMSGWGFWGSGGEDRVKDVLQRLDGGKDLGSEAAYEEAMHREYS